MKFVMDAEAKGSVHTRDMTFCDLEKGEVFMDEDKILYICTAPFSNEFEDYNAVDLNTGELTYFNERDKVWKYEGSVVFNPNAFNNKVVI